jgi:hypothetical protein
MFTPGIAIFYLATILGPCHACGVVARVCALCLTKHQGHQTLASSLNWGLSTLCVMEIFKAFINSVQHELCDRCESIFTVATTEEIEHSPHHNIIDLQASGSAGCSLCQLFYSQLSDEAVLELQNQIPPPAGEVFGPRRFAVPHPLAVPHIGLQYIIHEHETYECKVAIIEDKQGICTYISTLLIAQVYG